MAGIIFKIIVSFSEGYMIPQGWMHGLILDISSVYILATSEVKHKWIYLLCGAIAYIGITVLLATFATFDLVYMGW